MATGYFFGNDIGSAENAKEDAKRFLYQTQLANRNYDFQEQNRRDRIAENRAQLQRQDYARALQARQYAIANTQNAEALRSRNLFDRDELAQRLAIANNQNATSEQNVFARIAAENQRKADELALRREIAGRRATGMSQGAEQLRALRNPPRSLAEARLIMADKAYSPDAEIELIRTVAERQRQAKEYRNEAQQIATSLNALLQNHIATEKDPVTALNKAALWFKTNTDPGTASKVRFDPVSLTIKPISGVAGEYPEDAMLYFKGQLGLPKQSYSQPIGPLISPSSDVVPTTRSTYFPTPPIGDDADPDNPDA